MIAVRLKPAVHRLPKPVQLQVPVLLVPVLVRMERALVLPLVMLRLHVLPVLALVLLLAMLRLPVLRLATLRLLVDRPPTAVLRTVPIAELLVPKTAVLLPSAANNRAAMMIRAKSRN